MRFDRDVVATLTLAIIVGCAEPVPGPGPVSGEQAVLGKIKPDDPRLQERERARGRSDAEFEAAVEKGKWIVVVGFKPELAPMGVGSRGESLVPAADVARHTNALRGVGRMVYQFKNIPAVVLVVPNARAAAALRRLPWVDYVAASEGGARPDAPTVGCVGYTRTANSLQSTHWGLDQIGAPAAWAYATGAGGKILVMDDGIDAGSSDDIWVQGGIGFITPPDGDGDHGTGVASVATAANNNTGMVGAAPDAALIVGQAHYDEEGEAYYFASVIDRAFDGTKVINMSFSKPVGYPFSPPSGWEPFHDAIVNAYYQRGITLVASTGNTSAWVGRYPARYAEVIGVGGSGHNDEWIDNDWAPGNVEVAAPAIDIDYLCKGGTAIGTTEGTTYATALVSGAIMLLRQYHPDWSNADVRYQLSHTAVPMADADKSGAGRINVYAALGIANLTGVSIGGPASMPVNYTAQYTATPVGGFGPYTYTWRINGIPQQTGSSNSFYWTGTESFTVSVTVRDATTAEATGSMGVTVCEGGVFSC
jgi:subtilisin